MGKKKGLKRTGSTSSMASLSSLSSIQMHLPERKGADFLNEDEVRERGTFSVAPLDLPAFQKLSQNVQPRDVIPEVVRSKRFNRHMDVLPDPRTRVVLPMVNGDEATTYINANYVRGAGGNQKAYICAMGPLPATLKNWWRMIWQEKVTCIAMVTGLVEKGVKKCERYWAPKPGQKVKVAEMFVRTVAVSEGKGYLRTLLEIQHTSGQTRKLMHLWYHSWPDHGVPRTEEGKPDATNLLYLIRDARRSEKQLSVGGPLLTHCSAGVGRSGTLMALDMACQLLEANKRADLIEIVRAIRNDRVALVQHPQQFELAHAGCVLYAEFVEANLDLSDRAKAAPVTYDKKAFALAIEASKSGGVAGKEEDITPDLYEAIPEAKEPQPYGQIAAPITPKTQPAAAAKQPPPQQQQQQPQQQEEVYGQMTQPSNVYGQAAKGAVTSNDVYGAPVKPVGAGQSAPANPFGHVKLKKVASKRQQEEEEEDNDPGTNEYSVMKHVPIAQQHLLYEDAEEDNANADTNGPVDSGEVYGAPVASTAGQAQGGGMYGNQEVVNEESKKKAANVVGQPEYFNQGELNKQQGAAVVDANASQLYANDGAEEEERKRKEAEEAEEAEEERKRREEERKRREAEEAEEERKRREAEAEEERKRREAEAEEERKRREAEAEEERKRREAEAEERKQREAFERKKREAKAAAEQKIAKLKKELDANLTKLDAIMRDRKKTEEEVDGIDSEVRQCQSKLRNAKSLERDASIALQQAETALQSQREQIEELSRRMNAAQQREVEEKERRKREAEKQRAANILAAVGLTSSTTGVKHHAQSLALAMQPASKGRAIPPVRRKIVTDKAAGAESKREAVDEMQLLAAVSCVSKYR